MSDPVPVTWVRPRRPAGRPRRNGSSTRVAAGIAVFGLVTAPALALRTGDQLRIRYDPGRPEVTLWDVRDPPDFTGATIFMAAMAAAFALGSILFFKITQRLRRAR
jgi:hypothetical protein